MSLIKGTTTDNAVVIIRTIGEDERGDRVPIEVSRVIVPGRLSPSTNEDIERVGGTGDALLQLMRFTCYEFPGDDLSLVEVGGTTYEVKGGVQRYRSSRRTARDVVMLVAKSQNRLW